MNLDSTEVKESVSGHIKTHEDFVEVEEKIVFKSYPRQEYIISDRKENIMEHTDDTDHMHNKNEDGQFNRSDRYAYCTYTTKKVVLFNSLRNEKYDFQYNSIFIGIRIEFLVISSITTKIKPRCFLQIVPLLLYPIITGD